MVCILRNTEHDNATIPVSITHYCHVLFLWRILLPDLIDRNRESVADPRWTNCAIRSSTYVQVEGVQGEPAPDLFLLYGNDRGHLLTWGYIWLYSSSVGEGLTPLRKAYLILLIQTSCQGFFMAILKDNGAVEGPLCFWSLSPPPPLPRKDIWSWKTQSLCCVCIHIFLNLYRKCFCGGVGCNRSYVGDAGREVEGMSGLLNVPNRIIRAQQASLTRPCKCEEK